MSTLYSKNGVGTKTFLPWLTISNVCLDKHDAPTHDLVRGRVSSRFRAEGLDSSSPKFLTRFSPNLATLTVVVFLTKYSINIEDTEIYLKLREYNCVH